MSTLAQGRLEDVDFGTIPQDRLLTAANGQEEPQTYGPCLGPEMAQPGGSIGSKRPHDGLKGSAARPRLCYECKTAGYFPGQRLVGRHRPLAQFQRALCARGCRYHLQSLPGNDVVLRPGARRCLARRMGRLLVYPRWLSSKVVLGQDEGLGEGDNEQVPRAASAGPGQVCESRAPRMLMTRQMAIYLLL